MTLTFDWTKAIYPIAVLLAGSGLIIFVRWFGRFENQAEAIGSDLNLFSYGFAIDLLVKLFKNSAILPGWPYGKIPTLVPVFVLIVVNGILYMINLRLGERIKASNHNFAKMSLKTISLFLGFVSASCFIFVETMWG